MALFMMFVHNNRHVSIQSCAFNLCEKLEYGTKQLRLKHVQDNKIVTSWEIGAKYL